MKIPELLRIRKFFFHHYNKKFAKSDYKFSDQKKSISNISIKIDLIFMGIFIKYYLF
jgi:hypothetical protein